jgi:hypothetical protein
MTMQRTPKRLFRNHRSSRTVDIYWHLMIATLRTRQNALHHFAALLFAFGLTMPRVDYGQMTNKPRVGVATDSGANDHRKDSSAPMERLLIALAGEWSTEIIYEPSEQVPQGGTGRSRDSYRVGPARTSLVQEYHADGAGGRSWGTGIFWWDDKAQGFRFVWCDSFVVDAGCRVSSDLSNWDGDSFVVTDTHEESGKRVVEREVWSSFAPNSFSQTLYVGDSRDALKKYMMIKATRVGRPRLRRRPAK